MQQNLAVLDDQAEQIVGDLGIPTCPAILTKLVREMREDEPDFLKIGRLVSGDVSLAAAMLKTVNSPFYGLPTKAKSVPQALALLGLRNVAQLVTGLLLRQAFAGSDSQAMEEFWESSAGISQIAAWLAPKVKGINRDDAYTFALFRDCGIPAMMSMFNDYRSSLGRTARGQEHCTVDGEDERYGTDHVAMGYKLATAWLLPEVTCDAVRHHHDYAAVGNGEVDAPPSSARLIALALVAEWLFAMHTSGAACREWAAGGEFALGQLDLTQEELVALVPEVGAVLAAQ
jgi:HD-like signal output (HDOD) protein